MALLSSSLMSNLWASNNKKTRSTLSANQDNTSTKSYPLNTQNQWEIFHQQNLQPTFQLSVSLQRESQACLWVWPPPVVCSSVWCTGAGWENCFRTCSAVWRAAGGPWPRRSQVGWWWGSSPHHHHSVPSKYGILGSTKNLFILHNNKVLLVRSRFWSNLATKEIFPQEISVIHIIVIIIINDYWGLLSSLYYSITDYCSPLAHLMNVVFPVEYWPTNSTVGRQENSASSKGGLWRLWNKWVSSKGLSVLLYWYRSPSFTVLKSSFLEKLLVRVLRELPFLMNKIMYYHKH